MKATKKPVTIDYLPYKGNIEDVLNWVDSLGEDFYSNFSTRLPTLTEDGKLFVLTLEGTSYEVTIDDYLIMGVSHEFYPCKKDIFYKTYDIIE